MKNVIVCGEGNAPVIGICKYIMRTLHWRAMGA